MPLVCHGKRESEGKSLLAAARVGTLRVALPGRGGGGKGGKRGRESFRLPHTYAKSQQQQRRERKKKRDKGPTREIISSIYTTSEGRRWEGVLGKGEGKGERMRSSYTFLHSEKKGRAGRKKKNIVATLPRL